MASLWVTGVAATVWQLSDSERLLIAWKETEGVEPRLAEIELMEEFRAAFGALPFANLVT